MAEAPEGAKPNPETVLLVHDDVLVRMSLAAFLRECGYRVLEATSGDEALTMLKEANITIDVVFSDLQMPGPIDGFGLSRWLRANRPEMDMILAATEQRAAEAAGDMCVDGPLPKPYHPQSLVDRIKQLRAVRDRKR